MTVTAVKERELPELDDEFAQLASEFDTLDELKADLTAKAEVDAKFAQGVAARDQLLEAILEKVEVPIPESIVEAEVHSHLEGEGRLEDDEHRAEVGESTRKGLKTQLVLDAIAEKEEVQVEQQELIEFLVMSSQQYGMDPNQFAQSLDQEGQIPAMVAEVARRKALATVLEKVSVKDTAGNVIDLNEAVPGTEGDEDADGVRGRRRRAGREGRRLTVADHRSSRWAGSRTGAGPSASGGARRRVPGRRAGCGGRPREAGTRRSVAADGRTDERSQRRAPPTTRAPAWRTSDINSTDDRRHERPRAADGDAGSGRRSGVAGDDARTAATSTAAPRSSEPRERSLDQAGRNGSLRPTSGRGRGRQRPQRVRCRRPARTTADRRHAHAADPAGRHTTGGVRACGCAAPAQVCALTANTARFGKSARGVGR